MSSVAWDVSALADPRGVWLSALPVIAGTVILVAAVILFLRWEGPSRGAFLGTAVALASIPATLAVAVSTDQTRQLLAGLALIGPQGLASIAAEGWSASRTLFWGGWASLVLLLLFAALVAAGMKRRPGASGESEAPRPVRAVLVLALPLLPMLLAAVAATQESRIPRIVLGTFVEPLSNAERAASQAEMEALVPGSTQPGAGAIALVTDTVTFRILLVEAGALLVCGLLLAAAVAASVLGRRVRVSPAFVSAGFALTLLGLTGTAALASNAHARMARMRVLASETPARWQAREARFAAREAEHARACEAGDADACSAVAAKAAEDPATLEFLDKACARGVMPACGNLGWVYTNRSDSPADQANAAALLKRACAGGHQESCSIVEHYYPGASPTPGPSDQQRLVRQR